MTPILENKTSGLLKSGPGIERIKAAYFDADKAVDMATAKALYFGMLLLEQSQALNGGKRANQHSEEDQKVTVWLEKALPEIPLQKAQRWMRAARRSIEAVGAPPVIEIGVEIVPTSMILFAPEKELTTKALQYRQLWFDWAADKTISDCLKAVAVEGDAESRIARANNGKNAKGAGGGGDRKDFAKFIRTKLQHIGTFLFVARKSTTNKPAHFREFKSDVSAKIVAHFMGAVKKWPRWLLTPLAQVISKELKLSDEERANRNEQEKEEGQ